MNEIKLALFELKQEVERMQLAEADEFQETILNATNPHKHPYIQDVKGVEYTFFPGVFNPNYAKAARLLLENLGVKEGDTVLDPFTGSGVDAVFAAKEGASKVVAIDKYTMPYLCTKYNVHQLGLEEVVDVRQGDVFKPLRENEKFDLIIANPPFRNSKPETNLEAAMRDTGYQTLTTFWERVDTHLADEGRIRMVFSDVGNPDYLLEQAKNHHFRNKIVATNKYAWLVKNKVYEFTR